MRLIGIVQDGKHDANLWLRRFADAYAEWLGDSIFPGSLNIDTGQRFDWHAPALLPFRRTFSLLPYGGERELFMVPCEIVMPRRQPCWLWTTTNAADDREDANVVELVASIHLRSGLGLKTGSSIEVEYPKDWANAAAVRAAARVGRRNRSVCPSFPDAASRGRR